MIIMPRTEVVAISNRGEEHNQHEMTLEVLAMRAGIHPAQVLQLMDFGLVEAARRQDTVLFFDATIVPHLAMIYRLRRDLGINLEGVAVVLDLLQKLRALERENELLRCRL
jgi:MerR family transcriptional regulator/heat shock protein HspR